MLSPGRSCTGSPRWKLGPPVPRPDVPILKGPMTDNKDIENSRLMTSQDDPELSGSDPDGGGEPGLQRAAATDVPPRLECASYDQGSSLSSSGAAGARDDHRDSRRVRGVGQSPGAEYGQLVIDEQQDPGKQAGPDRAERLLGERAVPQRQRLRGPAEGAAPAAGPIDWAGCRRVAAAGERPGPEAACQPSGPGGVGSGQHGRAQGAPAGAERGRAGRLN